MSAPFREYSVTLKEDHTAGTLGGIYSGLTIRVTITVKYIMLEDTGKPYTMMVEAYWVPELKHQLISPQYIHTEEVNPMSFQTHSGFEGEGIFAELMVNPKVNGYHRKPALQTITMKYNHQNNLPIHSAQLLHDQQWMASALEAAICETRNHNKNLTAYQR